MIPAPDNWTVTLTLPCAPEYVGTARLTMLGVASRMGFTYDEIEDIRLAVGEACTGAIDRAKRAGLSESAILTLRCLVDTSRLALEIEDNIPPATSNGTDEENDIDPAELGAVLIEILVDEAEVKILPTGTRVCLVKHSMAIPSEIQER